MHHNPEPWYPFGQSSAHADAEARRQHEFYRWEEYQRKREEELKRMREERERKRASDAEMSAKAWKEYRRRMEENSFSTEFAEKWNDDVGQNTTSKSNDDALRKFVQRMENEIRSKMAAADIYGRANDR